MRDQLVSLSEGSTFERARLRYARTVDRLVDQGLGRRTASRVGVRDRYWSSTRDVLDEAMRLGLVERQRLPSARRYVDAHRDRVYTLSDLGRQTAEEARTDVRAFYDRLASAVYSKHPYFRAFIDVLRSVPIGCPEVSEGEVERARQARLATSYWVDFADERIPRQTATDRDKIQIRDAVVSTVRHRFGDKPKSKPTSKQLTEALNDAFIEAVIAIRGLSFGAIELKTMKSWGSQLLLVDQSRYVPAHPRQNVIWLASDTKENGGTHLERKTMASHERNLVKALIAAYRQQADNMNSSLQAPYIPIFKVRAQAAFECGVTRVLVDGVIERLAKGGIPESNVNVWLHLGTTRQPNSEPVYQRGGSRRYEITIQAAS